MSLLEVRNISFGFENSFWLRDISFSLKPGEVMCILGPNGSGKTTLFNVITGAVMPYQGHIVFDGLNIHRYRDRFSDQSVCMPFYPAMHTLKTPCLYWQGYGQRFGMSFKEVATRIWELSPQMNMIGKLHAPTSSLSLGMRQKVGLVASFIPQVKIRILDEPFNGGIDPFAIEVLIEWIRSARLRNEIIIFTTQFTEHVERMADKVLVLQDGRQQFFGSPQEMVQSLGSAIKRPLVQAYIELTEKDEPR